MSPVQGERHVAFTGGFSGGYQGGEGGWSHVLAAVPGFAPPHVMAPSMVPQVPLAPAHSVGGRGGVSSFHAGLGVV